MFDPRKTRRVWHTAFVAVGLIVSPLSFAEESCGVKVAAELSNQEPSGKSVRLVFDVSLEGSCDCATVTYDLVLEEQLPNAQWKAVRETRSVEMRGATGSDRVEHLMSQEIKLIGYSARAVESTVCSTAKEGEGQG